MHIQMHTYATYIYECKRIYVHTHLLMRREVSQAESILLAMGANAERSPESLGLRPLFQGTPPETGCRDKNFMSQSTQAGGRLWH